MIEEEVIKTLGALGAMTIAAIVLFYVARIVSMRSKSDIDTIKLFVDLLSGSLKETRETVTIHSDESETRHMEIVNAIKEQVTATRKLIDTFQSKDENIATSIGTLSNNIETHIQKVEEVGGNIMGKVTPLEEILAGIHEELKDLRKSVDSHLTDSTTFRNDVITKTESMESRLLQVESRVTQEAKVIEPEKPIIKTGDSKLTGAPKPEAKTEELKS